MNVKAVATVAIVLAILGLGDVAARPVGSWDGRAGYGQEYRVAPAMMGGWGGYGGYGMGPGMMGGWGGYGPGYGQGAQGWNQSPGYRGGYGPGYGMGPGMMWGYGGYSPWGGNFTAPGPGYGRGYGGYGPGYGMGPGMMWGYGGYGPGGIGYGANATPMAIEKAKEIVEQYLAVIGNPDLKLAEVMEFDNNFYAGVKEKSTGIYAFELLVNKYTGAISPEFGPNMMWNTKYGHMSWGYSAQGAVTRDQAIEYAQNYLDSVLPGTKVGDADAFYGYYTIEVLKDGRIYGMLSVNGYTGAVWYHTWHGEFIKILEVE